MDVILVVDRDKFCSESAAPIPQANLIERPVQLISVLRFLLLVVLIVMVISAD